MRTTMFIEPKDEAEAMRVALEEGGLARAWMALRAGIALALNPTDTRLVF